MSADAKVAVDLMITGACVAATGPSAAGLLADRDGSFAAPLGVLGFLLLPLCVAGFVMGTPRRRQANALAPYFHRN